MYMRGFGANASRLHRGRGTILIVVLGVILILTGFTLVFCREMRVEALASANSVAMADASAIERAGEQFAIAEIVDQQDAVLSLPDTTFAGVPVGDGYFWIVRPDYGDDIMPTFGLVDEASKVNINHAKNTMLDNLAVLTPDVSDSIVDWIKVGSDSPYYQSLPSPYQSKQAPFETVEELLLIRGMTSEMLYGEPSNGPLSDPDLARGIFNLVTVYSNEPTAGKTNVATASRSVLSRPNILGRFYSNATLNSLLNRVIANQNNISNIFQFARYANLNQSQLAQLANNIIAGDTKGAININTAPRQVLLCLDNLSDADVDQLIAQRPSFGTSTDIAWAYPVLVNKPGTINVTGQSFQYSADIVAVSGDGRAFKRVRVVIDATPPANAANSTSTSSTGTTTTTPRIIYRRDITDQGFPLVDDILTSLKQGNGLPPVATTSQARRSL